MPVKIEFKKLEENGLYEVKYPELGIIEHAHVDDPEANDFLPEFLLDEGIETREDVVGLILHAIQQGVSTKLFISGYEVEAILMDQTAGQTADLDDIFKTNHPEYPYQRLKDIFDNTFQP